VPHRILCDQGSTLLPACSKVTLSLPALMSKFSLASANGDSTRAQKPPTNWRDGAGIPFSMAVDARYAKNHRLPDDAERRGTTCYLVQRRIDMLPKPLTEDICSLRSGVERLAFSAIWEMTAGAEVVAVRCAVIVPDGTCCCKRPFPHQASAEPSYV